MLVYALKSNQTKPNGPDTLSSNPGQFSPKCWSRYPSFLDWTPFLVIFSIAVATAKTMSAASLCLYVLFGGKLYMKGEPVLLVSILEEVYCVSLRVNTFWKGMNPYILQHLTPRLLCRGVRPLHTTSVLDMTQNNLMVMLDLRKMQSNYSLPSLSWSTQARSSRTWLCPIYGSDWTKLCTYARLKCLK